MNNNKQKLRKKISPELLKKANDIIEKLGRNNNIIGLNPKHVCFIIDITPIEKNKKDIKFLTKKYKIIKSIYESFLSNVDYISLYTYGYQVPLKKIIPLTKKNSDNYFFIACAIDSVWKNEKKSGILNEIKQDEYLRYTIKVINSLIYEHVQDKNKLHFMLFSESLQVSSNEEKEHINYDLICEEVTSVSYNNSLHINFIGDLLTNQSKFNAFKKHISSNGFQNIRYYEFDNYQQIRKNMCTIGNCPRGYEYQNE